MSSVADFFLQFHSFLFSIGVFLVKLEDVQVTDNHLTPYKYCWLDLCSLLHSLTQVAKAVCKAAVKPVLS